MNKWRIVIGSVAILLALVVAIDPLNLAGANGEDRLVAYLPSISRDTGYRFDDFEDLVPEWDVGFIKEPWQCDGENCWGDGYFEYVDGKYQATIADNAAMIVMTPWWRTHGDFRLKVKGRFTSDFTVEQRLKSYNGLGIVFGANEDFSEFYALMLADGGEQHSYALVYSKDTRFENIYGWRGAPNFVKNWNGTNHIEVIRQGDHYQILCNDKVLPGGEDLVDSRLGDDYVGVIVTSYEFSDGQMDFNDFELTPIGDWFGQ